MTLIRHMVLRRILRDLERVGAELVDMERICGADRETKAQVREVMTEVDQLVSYVKDKLDRC